MVLDVFEEVQDSIGGQANLWGGRTAKSRQVGTAARAEKQSVDVPNQFQG